MKARKVKSTGFVPFDLILSVETRKEASALYAIFNHVPNMVLLSDEASAVVKRAIGEEFVSLFPPGR